MHVYIYELYCEETDEYYIGRTKRTIKDRFFEHRARKNDSIYEWMHKHKIIMKELIYKDNVSKSEAAELELKYSLTYLFEGKKLINKSLGNYKRTMVERLINRGLSIDEIIKELHHEFIEKEELYKLYKITFNNLIYISMMNQPYRIMKYWLKKKNIDLDNSSCICLYMSRNKKDIQVLRKLYIEKFMECSNMYNKKIGDNFTKEEIEHRRRINKRNKKVQCSVNGKIYRSMREAAREVGATHISDCILGKRETSGKINGIPCRWKLVD